MLRVRFASRTGIFVGLAAIAGLWASVAAAPANLVSNGSFGSTVVGWPGAQWDPVDTQGAPGSGSARVINTSSATYPNSAYATQCVNGITAGAEYRISADAFVAAGQGHGAAAGIGADGYSGLNCTGSWTGFLSAGSLGSGGWQLLENTGTYPVGTQSVMVMLQSGKNNPTTPSASTSVLFDNVFFGLAEGGPGPGPGPEARPYRLFAAGVAKQ